MRLRLGLAGALLVLVGCGGGAAEARIDIDLFEFGIATSTDSFVVGPVDLALSNSGEFPHTIVVESANGEILGASELLLPGDTTELSFDLGAESYRITCRIVAEGDDGTLFDHYELGMIASLRPAGSG